MKSRGISVVMAFLRCAFTATRLRQSAIGSSRSSALASRPFSLPPMSHLVVLVRIPFGFLPVFSIGGFGHGLALVVFVDGSHKRTWRPEERADGECKRRTAWIVNDLQCAKPPRPDCSHCVWNGMSRTNMLLVACPRVSSQLLLDCVVADARVAACAHELDTFFSFPLLLSRFVSLACALFFQARVPGTVPLVSSTAALSSPACSALVADACRSACCSRMHLRTSALPTTATARLCRLSACCRCPPSPRPVFLLPPLVACSWKCGWRVRRRKSGWPERGAGVASSSARGVHGGSKGIHAPH
eukprot:m.19193 g.19193  ORF g.19193 m.19193 type:complete len:301 (+) comp3725_c0_seq1:1153-2055(+)